MTASDQQHPRQSQMPADRPGLPSAAREAATGAVDPHLLKQTIHALDETSRPFIERVMNRAIKQVVAGHSVEEY